MRVIIYCILLFLGNDLLRGANLEVCESCAFHTIHSALEATEDGDVVIIHEGVYNEFNMVIDKSIELCGLEGAIIDAQDMGEIITVIADDVKICGLTIMNVGNSYTEDRAAIRIRKSKNFLIEENKLINTFFGIYLEHSRDGIVIDNEIEGDAKEEMSSGNAIHIWYCKNILINNNVVSHHRDGIYLEFVDNSTVINNLSTENLRYGLHFMFSNDDNYANNIFRNNGAGVAVMFSKKINMWNNRFEYNWGKASYGLLLKEIYDAEITNNVFLENTIGIYVEGSTRINYKFNDFVQNGWAIKVSGGCLSNHVGNNNFISNTFDLSALTTSNDNSFTGNYWSSYSGYDLDKNGVGDVPYRPVKLFNYIVNRTPESIVLMRSLFVDIINFSERVSPMYTPKNVIDSYPAMQRIEKNNYDIHQRVNQVIWL